MGHVNADTLRAILRKNRDTDFGRGHGFASLHTVADYRRALPVSTYDAFRPYVERIARGEHRVLGADKVQYLGVSSGTTGTRKFLPISRAYFGRMNRAGSIGQAILAEKMPSSSRSGRTMLLMNAVLSERSEGGIPMGALAAIGSHSLRHLAALARFQLARRSLRPPETSPRPLPPLALRTEGTKCPRGRRRLFVRASGHGPSARAPLAGSRGRYWPWRAPRRSSGSPGASGIASGPCSAQIHGGPANCPRCWARARRASSAGYGPDRLCERHHRRQLWPLLAAASLRIRGNSDLPRGVRQRRMRRRPGPRRGPRPLLPVAGIRLFRVHPRGGNGCIRAADAAARGGCRGRALRGGGDDGGRPLSLPDGGCREDCRPPSAGTGD